MPDHLEYFIVFVSGYLTTLIDNAGKHLVAFVQGRKKGR